MWGWGWIEFLHPYISCEDTALVLVWAGGGDIFRKGVTGRPQKSQAAIGISIPSGMSTGSTSVRYGYNNTFAKTGDEAERLNPV
jgi:hypothetical protein